MISFKNRQCFLLSQVNRTFQDFEIMAQVHAAWEEVGPRLKSFMESSVEIRMLQVLYQYLNFV